MEYLFNVLNLLTAILFLSHASLTKTLPTMVNTYFSSTSSSFLFTLPTSSLLSASPSSYVFSSISFRKLDGQSLADYTSWSPSNNQRRNLVTSENGHETSFNNGSISSVNFYWEHRIATIINLYVPPFLVILGTICNCLVVLVMAGHWFSSVSTSVYMISGTIADTASLLIALPAHWVYVNFPDSIQRSEHSHIMCKFFNFFGWGSSDYGIILTVAMTIDKAIAILFPIKAQANCTTKRSKRVIFILFIFIVIKESHFLFVSNIVPPGRTEQLCTIDIPNDVYRVFYKHLWPAIHNLFLFCSFIVIIICNIIIIVRIKRSRSFKDFSESRRSSQGMDRSKSRQITVMLLVESFTLVILTLPFSLHVTIISSSRTEPNSTALNQLVFAIVFYLLYVNR